MQASLTAQVRDEFGKERAKKIRAQGRVPGVIYGTAREPEHVVISSHDLEVLAQRIHGQTVLVDLQVIKKDGSKETEKIFVRELQRDPVTEKIIHADLLRVDLAKPVILEIPVAAVGVPAGVKMGGLLETLARTVTVRCLPEKAVPHVDIDVSQIGINESIHVSEVVWPEGLEMLTDEDTALFTVLGKRGLEAEEEEAAPAEEGEAPAEPEVIGRKKKEEAEEEEKD